MRMLASKGKGERSEIQAPKSTYLTAICFRTWCEKKLGNPKQSKRSPLDPEKISQGREKVCSSGKRSSHAQRLLLSSVHLPYFSRKYLRGLSVMPSSALVTLSPACTLCLPLADADGKQASRHTLSGCPTWGVGNTPIAHFI